FITITGEDLDSESSITIRFTSVVMNYFVPFSVPSWLLTNIAVLGVPSEVSTHGCLNVWAQWALAVCTRSIEALMFLMPMYVSALLSKHGP
uniref:Uncharacterized protein n=1 Tax=Erpetoichthys calabaricus TaxID=27687 RepID=A0A8C4TMY3_ERPCA